MISLSRRALVAILFLSAGISGRQSFGQSGGIVSVVKVEGENAVSSAGLLAKGTLYVAGQNGRNADGAVPNDFQREVRQSLNKLQRVLRAAKMDFGDIAWMHVYVTSEQNLPAMNEVYWKSIGAHPPARTVLYVGQKRVHPRPGDCYARPGFATEAVHAQSSGRFAGSRPRFFRCRVFHGLPAGGKGCRSSPCFVWQVFQRPLPGADNATKQLGYEDRHG
jgi:2-iminobutanoate/2-iminopropanoate deaminase